jgi:hypothetical protein
MKAFIWLPLACLAGIIIGAWGPREELLDFKENVRKQAMEQGRWSASRSVVANGFESFTRLANIHEEAHRPHRRNAGAKPLFHAATNKPPAAVAVATNKPPAEAVAAPAEQSPARNGRDPSKDLRARIEEAQDLWNTRVELARTKWKTKLELDDAAAERFEAALDTMNEQLYDTMLTMATLLSKQDKLTPELGLRMMGDASTIMAEAYENLGACVPADRRAEVSEIPVFEFIDPGVAEPLISVQDKLQGFEMHSRGGRR